MKFNCLLGEIGIDQSLWWESDVWAEIIDVSKGKDERLNDKGSSMLKSLVMRESMASPKEE